VAVADAELERWALVMGAVVGLGAAVLAAVVPALRLARKQPIAALTMRGRELVATAAERRPWTWTLVCTVAAVLSALAQRRAGLPWLGNVTTIAIAIAVAVAAGPLVTEGGRALGTAWRWGFGPAGGFAAWHLRQNARRAAFMVATIGIGLGVVYMF